MGYNARANRPSRPLAILVALAIMLTIAAPILMLGPGSVKAAPPAMGDWIITGQETLSDTEVTLTGNLTVVLGGHLTLDNVTIIMNCSFNGQFNVSVRTGGTLIMRNSTVAPVDFLQRYRYNFNIGLGATAEIYDSTLVAIGEGNLTRPQTLGLYIESSNVKIVNNIITRLNVLYLATGIGIGPLASPLIKGNQISGLYPSGITLLLGSNSIIRENDIAGAGIGITCLASTPTLVSNDISSNLVGISATSCSVDMSWNLLSGNLFSGISANASELTMDRDQFVDNAAHMVLNTTGLMARKVQVTGGANGIEVDNGGSKAIRFENSSLSSGGEYVITINNSEVHMLNTEFDHDKVNMSSVTAELYVDWFLNITVSYVSGDPAISASVSVEDVDNVTVLQGQTDSGGRMALLEIEEYHRVGDLVSYRSPHEVTATKDTMTNTVEVLMDSSKDLMIELDDLPPIVTILEPQEGGIFNTSTIDFSGNATDNGQIAKVEYRLQGGAWYIADGTAQWNFTLSLTDGEHHLTVRATDLGGNLGLDRVNITVDTEAPTLSIISPKDGALLNRTPVTVEGKTDSDAVLTLAGSAEPIPVGPTGSFSFDHNLTEGKNLITLVARDLAGNELQRTVNVTLDMTPPSLNVTSPEDGLITNRSTVILTGTTDTGGSITVTVNGLPVTVGPTGRFVHTLLLSDGNYTFTVVARDPAGNAVSDTRHVIVDTIPPGLEITGPTNGLLTKEKLVNIVGRAETNRVWINGQDAEPTPSSASGWWTIDEMYPLAEGTNSIVIEAMDKAGNINRVTLALTLDTTPPALTVTEPLDGSTTKKNQILVTGTTEAGATLSIGGQSVTDTDGSFSVPFNLEIGENTIKVTATDRAGNQAEVTIKVTRQRLEHQSTELEGNFALLFLFVVFLVIIVFLLFYNFAMSRRSEEGNEAEKAAKEEEEELDMDEPPDLDEDRLEELKSLDAEDVDDEGPSELPPGPVPERSTLVLGGQHIEPASWRDSPDMFSRPRERDLDGTEEEQEEDEDEEARPKPAKARPRPKARGSSDEMFKRKRMKKVTKRRPKA